MKISSLAATRLLLLSSVAFASLHAATVTYTINNFTDSNGGSAPYSVASNLTFTNLSLNLLYSDGFQRSVSLFDFNNAAQTSLDTNTIDLRSAVISDSDPALGALLSARTQGSINQTTIGLAGATFNPGVVVSTDTVNPQFTSTLTFGGATSNNLTVSSTTQSATYAIGTFEQLVTGTPSAAVPEPGTLAIASLGLLGLFAGLRRQKKENA